MGRKEPYSEFTARHTVLRLLELIAPAGTSTHTLSNPIALSPGSTIFEAVRDGTTSDLAGPSDPVYEQVEISGRKGKSGKKEVVKVKPEAANAHAFTDWKEDWESTPLSRLPMSQPPVEGLPCVRAIQLSSLNPPPPHLRQLGHQLYLQTTLLEGDVLTLVCSSRGWYVANANSIHAPPSTRPNHSIIDLLHSLSPRFSERLALLPPLASTAASLDPISTVSIPQAEPAYPWLATPIKPSAEVLRSQLAYLHTGATLADSLDAARDWNEEIQGIKELPREAMQERVMREKMAQKTWAEFTQASVRGVIAVAVSRNLLEATVPRFRTDAFSRSMEISLLSILMRTLAATCG